MEPGARTAGGAFTLPGEYYTSREIFAEEREKIFMRLWLYAGHLSELREAGQYIVRSLDHESVVIVRDKDGEIRAFHNVCRHRGCRICAEEAGRFTGGIQCPYHAWTYTLQGALKGAPHMDEVPGFARSDYPLLPVPVGIWEGLVFVSLAGDPQPFSEWISPLTGKFDSWRIGGLQSARQTVYEVEANWKLFFQNYSECYHCPAVHPVLNRLTPYRDSTNDLDEGSILGGPMKLADPEGSMTMDGSRCAPPVGEVSGVDLGLVHYYTVLPNLFLSLHPDYVLVHRSESLAVDRTRITCDWLFEPAVASEPDFDPSGAVEFWDMTNRQDWELCSNAQLGISSRAYLPGPYSELESQLAAFDREYLKILGRQAT